MKNSKKTFFQLPQIIGGKEAFKKYVEDNLIYPAEAREKSIEGIVHLKAEIDDNGKVIHVEILHGLGDGCNEEAIRLIKKLRFGAVKNKGVRLKTNKRFKIKFQLTPENMLIPPENQINYELVSQPKKTNPQGFDKTYSYTIPLK